MSFQIKSAADVKPACPFDGLERRVLTYDSGSMLCHFTEEAGTEVALHTHEAAQHGYILKGAVRFYSQDGSDFVARPGDGYYFPPMYPHGSVALEVSELVEFFLPCREDYIPQT